MKAEQTPHGNSSQDDKHATSYFSLGLGNELFSIKIRLEYARNLNSIFNESKNPKEEVWLSYSCCQIIAQTEKIKSFEQSTFSSSDEFNVCGSLSELKQYFRKIGTLQVHVCTAGAVHGSGSFNWGHGLANATFSKGTCHFFRESFTIAQKNHKHSVKQSHENIIPTIGASVIIERKSYGSDVNVIKNASERKKIDRNPFNSCPNDQEMHQANQILRSNEQNLSRAELGVKGRHAANTMYFQHQNNFPVKDMCSIDTQRQRREFEDWMRREELAWNEKLRSKEAAAMRSLEEREKQRDKERDGEIEAARLEYGRLETRLRKFLADVEKRERQLKNDEHALHTTYNQKGSELELQRDLMKQETRVIVNVEKVKTAAAHERVVIAERKAAAAEQRCEDAEETYEQLRKKKKDSREELLSDELGSVKSKLSHAQIEMNMIQKSLQQSSIENEQLKKKLYRLLKIFRREQEKGESFARKESEKTRLEFVAREQRYILDVDRDELQRIKSDLKTLNGMPSTFHSVVPPNSDSDETFKRSTRTSTASSIGCFTHDPSAFTPSPLASSGRFRQQHMGFDLPLSHSDSTSSQLEINRLLSEKEKLLETGIYSEEHPLIIGLNTRIRQIQ
eukprot:CAMPEP_0194370658 /NCGR_PEP_ID=MMETSP0174-20130528/18984_1 /TAXON_ID=216777 /ORGANISM="Proboscia alata, Strain PI-D3" /LENGTH=620 /DNA_ID=CAMNT_0039148249 /DNA_START=40 /DNA_END=1902 /DNA_ORIENTATION=-